MPPCSCRRANVGPCGYLMPLGARPTWRARCRRSSPASSAVSEGRMTDHLRVARRGDGLLRLHLDKPDKRNALDDDMVTAMIDELIIGSGDESIRAALLTAAGDHFCSGFDIVGRNASAASDAPPPRLGSM